MNPYVSFSLLVFTFISSTVALASASEYAPVDRKTQPTRIHCEAANPVQSAPDPITESTGLEGQAQMKDDGVEEQCTVAFAD